MDFLLEVLTLHSQKVTNQAGNKKSVYKRSLLSYSYLFRGFYQSFWRSLSGLYFREGDSEKLFVLHVCE